MSDKELDDVEDTDVYDAFDLRGVVVNDRDGDEGTETLLTVAILGLPLCMKLLLYAPPPI